MSAADEAQEQVAVQQVYMKGLQVFFTGVLEHFRQKISTMPARCGGWVRAFISYESARHGVAKPAEIVAKAVFYYLGAVRALGGKL